MRYTENDTELLIYALTKQAASKINIKNPAIEIITYIFNVVQLASTPINIFYIKPGVSCAVVFHFHNVSS